MLAVVVFVLVWGILRRNTPPHVSFVRVKRETLVSTLPTNGKVEPFSWEPVRAQASGLVSRVAVEEGQNVAAGALLAEMTDPALQTDVEAAEAKVAEARAALSALEAGGKPAELADIDTSLARARLELQQETSEYDSLRRLADKQAATAAEVGIAGHKMHQSQLQIQGLEKRRASLVAQTDLAASRARLQDAEVALDLARRRAAQGVLRAPIAGVVYGLAVRPGAYLNAGDMVTNVGRLDRLRVRVFVDEPELGRVAVGQPVTITWQALPARKWQGTVERMPSSIQPLGSRQVGEVVCVIDNPGRELIPGTNVDAEIRTSVVDNALLIPRETLHHDTAGDYVYALQGDTVVRCAVQPGVSSATMVQVVRGLEEGSAVALPSDVALKPGDRVTPVL